MPEAKLEIMGGRSSDGLTVTIRDRISGVTLASFRLDAEQAWKFTGGTVLQVDGEVSSRLDRVGKTMQHDSVTLDRASYSGDRELMLRNAEQNAKDNHPYWETYSARFSNDGRIVVVMRRWV